MVMYFLGFKFSSKSVNSDNKSFWRYFYFFFGSPTIVYYQESSGKISG